MKSVKLQNGLDWAVNNAIVIFSLVVAVLVYLSPKPSGYELMFLHPLIFAIFFKYNYVFKTGKFSRPCLLLIFLTLLIRFVIAPLLLVLADYPLLTIHDSASTNKGIILMCYEEILIFIIVASYGRKLLSYIGANNNGFLNYVNGNVLLYAIMLIGLVVLLSFPEVSQRYHFLFELTGNEYDKVNENTSAFLSFFVDMSRYILLLILISVFSKQYNTSKNPLYVVLSMMAIIINMLFVYDISRFSIVISAIVFVYLITQVYPKYKKSIIKSGFIALLFVIGVATIVKTFSINPGDEESANDIVKWADLIQMYFMGQRDVGLGIYVMDKLPDFGLFYFFNDAIQQIMFLNKFYVSQLGTLFLYNLEYNDGPWVDKIVPNISASYAYFGALLSPFITGVSVFFSLYFDVHSYKTNNIGFKFLFIYASLMCSLVMMQFYPMILSTLINTILPLFIILKINSIFEKTQSKNSNVISI